MYHGHFLEKDAYRFNIALLEDDNYKKTDRILPSAKIKKLLQS